MILKYLIIINIINFIMFGIDKAKAKKNKWRIPESTLLGLSLIGGSLGGIMAMTSFRHKTKKRKKIYHRHAYTFTYKYSYNNLWII